MKNSVFSFFLGLVFVTNITAQVLPSVSVVATDPLATEPGPANFPDTGTFTISRQGATNLPLMVFFTLEGSASNGVDYLKVETVVTIAEGSRIARVPIVPLVDELIEGDERVLLRIAPSPLAGPGSGYILPTNSIGAVVTIRDYPQQPTNALPMVQISRPGSGATFHVPADIEIVANTVDPDGWVPKVEFFANGGKIGESILTFVVQPPDGTAIEHQFDWKGVGPGEYSLTARATDDQGGVKTSLPVRVFVGSTNPPPRTVVSIVATDAEGSEIAEVPPEMERPQLIDPAIFTVTRTGALSNALTVLYTVAGTAVNGVDYVEIPREVTISAGESSAQIEINVIDDALAEGPEHVVITVIPPVCAAIYPPPPGCYVVGFPGRAEARIRDNDVEGTNRPPVVSIVMPTNGAVFTAPADIQIVAHAFDGDGYVHTVEFFAGTNSLGVKTNNPFVANIMNPFQLRWEDVPAGQYTLSALATDDRGAQSRSRPVWISVRQEPVEQTVVNIRAVDPEAAEQDPRLDSLPNNALLRVTRSGTTDADLSVFYRVGGTASNGVDYVLLTGEVVIPKGAEAADIPIEAIDDKLAERTESVLVTLVAPPCVAIWPPPPGCYTVGFSRTASAFILDDEPFDTNLPPRVEITRPISGATFRAPTHIQIVTKTVDRDGYVGKVEFYANNHKIGEASKQFLVSPPDGEPIEYDFTWEDVPPGQYALVARAIDDLGASGYSTPVRIAVAGTNTPPPTNAAVVTVYAIDGFASEGPYIGTNSTVRAYTNGAVFEIRREGNLDSSIRVLYETHGMATEGVDYLDLPGVVEIPAGARASRVVVVPIDDNLPEKLESVVLCLRPSPELSILPGYIVGRPSQAAAVIADNDAPRLLYSCLRDGLFHFSQPAADGQCYRVECSTDLQTWTELAVVRATDGAINYADANAPANERRFYRAVAVECP